MQVLHNVIFFAFEFYQISVHTSFVYFLFIHALQANVIFLSALKFRQIYGKIMQSKAKFRHVKD